MNSIKSVKVSLQTILFVVLFTSCGSTPSKSTKDSTTPEVSIQYSAASQPKLSEEFKIYYVRWEERAKGAENIGFISFSDDYPLSEHPDSIAIPDISDMPYDSIQYFELTGKYREQFLNKTGVSEDDKLFVFNYSTGKIQSFLIKKLLLSALINPYASEGDAPFDQFSYMIGFGIDRSMLSEIGGDYYNHVLVSVGKKNPFLVKKLNLITWSKVDSEKFPAVKFRSDIVSELKNFRKLETNMCQLDTLHFFAQELKEEKADYNRSARHVIVINTKSGKVEFEELYTENESVGIAHLNGIFKDSRETNQWTGQLFKNRSPVIFGFTNNSFGCSLIYFMGQPQRFIYTKCDSRH